MLTGAAYGAMSKLVLEAASFGYPSGLIFWPGAGLTLGILLRSHRSLWPAILTGVFVAEFAVDMTVHVSVLTGLCWAVADTAEPFVGATLMTWRGGTANLSGAREVRYFLIRGVVAGPLVGSLIGAVSSWLLEADQFWPTWPRWWVGDAVGALAIAPALFVRRRPDLAHARKGETVAILSALVAVTAIALVSWPGGVWNQGLPYLIAPVLVVVGMRLGPQSAATALAFTALAINSVTALGYGPFARYGVHGGLVVAQVCVAAGAFALLTVSAMNYNLVSLGRVQDMLREQAMHDSLTGLANRRMLIEHLEIALQCLKRTHGLVAVLYVDLDRFKVLNDEHGHGAGDAALMEVASRLRECVRPSDTVARIGGDEFAVVLNDLPDRDAVEAVRARVAAHVLEPFTWQGRALALAASVGFALTDDPDESVDDLLKRADTDMYARKLSRRWDAARAL